MLDEIIKQVAKNYDKSIIEFLELNGYKVPKVITKPYLDNLRQELTNQDKFVDTLNWVDYGINNATQHIIPFFNSISNPISEETKQYIIEELKKKNASS